MKALMAITLLVINFTLWSQPSLIYPKNGLVTDSASLYFSWNAVENASSYHLQIATDADFTNIIVDQSTILNTFYQGNSLSTNQRYYWRVSDDISGNWSFERSFRVVDLSNWGEVELWLRADSVEISSGNSVSTWYDLSGNMNHYIQPNSANQPDQLLASSTFNGGASISFNPSDPAFFEPRDFSYLSGGEVVTLMAVNNAPATSASSSGLWSFGTSTSQDHYPYNNNQIYCGFGRATRFTIGDISSFVDLTSPHILNTQSGSSFEFDINELNYFSSGSSSAAFSNTVYLGRSRSAHFMSGEIAELLFFDELLSDSIRRLTHQYLRCKYYPHVDLGANVYSYGFCDTAIFAGDHFESYLWSDGSTADSLIVSQPGTYWVEATDIFGYVSRDTILVEMARPNYPSSNFYCPSDSITWHTNLGPNYNYLWSDGSTADSLTINSPGDYHVEITDTNGCIFRSDTLTFGPDPFESIVNLGPDLDLCTGNTLTLQDGDSLAIDYLWNTSSTDSAIVLNTTGTYYVDVVNANGCEASDTIDISIIGDAPIVSIGAPTTACQDGEIALEDLSATTDGSTINSWNWELGDGSVFSAEDLNYIYSNDGVYDIELTVSTTAGCSNTLIQEITVLPKPEMDFVSVNQCQGATIQFNGGQLSPTTIASWEWSFDDPGSGLNNAANGQNVEHIFEASGDYDVSLIGTDINGCADTIIQTTTIVPSPQVDFSFDEICEGEVIDFQNATTIDPPGVVNTYNWSFGDGTNSGQENPAKPYNTSGNYAVTLSATSNNGCSGQTSENLKVHAIPIVDRLVESSCAGLNTSFSDQSFVSNGSVAQVFWSIENGVPLSGFSISQVFEEDGVYEVEQTVTSGFGCVNAEEFNVTINDLLQADFEYFPNAFIAGTPTDFVNTSIGATDYEWTIQGIGTATSSDTTVVFPTSMIGDTVQVQLAVENSFGCRDSVIIKLPVLERSTDLEVSELFLQEVDGFYTVGVRLTNKGTTPINEVDLVFNSPAQSLIKETWEGLLLAGESTIYVFESSPTATVPLEDTSQNFVCVRGTITQPTLFIESDLSNNEACAVIEPSSTVLIAPQPNPIGNRYTIKVVVSQSQKASLNVYDALGKKVDIIFSNTQLEKGLNTFNVDATNYAGGSYTLHFIGEEQTIRVKMIKR